jgi:predicted MFS family arabinose efflux permease
MTPNGSSFSSGEAASERTVAWRGVTPALIATIIAMLPGFLIAALVVQIGLDTGLTLTELGLLIGVFFGTAALVSPTVGRISERVGWATGLRAAMLLSAVGFTTIGWFAESTPVIAAALVVSGISASLTQTASNLSIARCVIPSRHGWLFGIKHACVPAAMFLAGLAVPTIALTVGWRWAFRIAAVLAVLTAALVPLREHPHTLTPRPLPVDASVGTPRTPRRLLITLAIAVGLGIGAADPLGSFFVGYSVSIGVEEQIAGLLLAAGGFCGITARLVAGRFIDRMAQADFTVIASMLIVGAVGIVILNVGGYPGLLVGGLLGFTAGWGWSGLFTFAVVKDNPEAPAAAWGIVQTGKFVGAATGPIVFGIVADRVSFSAAFWMSTVALLAAASLMIYVRNHRPPKVGTVENSAGSAS